MLKVSNLMLGSARLRSITPSSQLPVEQRHKQVSSFNISPLWAISIHFMSYLSQPNKTLVSIYSTLVIYPVSLVFVSLAAFVLHDKVANPMQILSLVISFDIVEETLGLLFLLRPRSPHGDVESILISWLQINCSSPENDAKIKCVSHIL